MGKKLVAGMLLLLLFWVSGYCRFQYQAKQQYSVNTPAKTEIPTDSEIVEGLKTSKTRQEVKR